MKVAMAIHFKADLTTDRHVNKMHRWKPLN